MSEGTKRNISVVKDADGNKIVVINDILFKGKRSVNWNDVKEYLKACIGKVYSIVETCDSIYVGKDLPDEYTGSEYTESLRGTNAKAKANASQGIQELLMIASGKHFRENTSNKHKRDAKYGWYRYDSRFALPVYGELGEVERYNVFHASMLIRHAADGKMYLYDIIHFIRREMLDFTAFPVFFVSNLLLVQRKKYYFNRATVSRNCSIVL